MYKEDPVGLGRSKSAGFLMFGGGLDKSEKSDIIRVGEWNVWSRQKSEIIKYM